MICYFNDCVMELIVVQPMCPEDVDTVVKIYREVFDGIYIGFGELAAGMGIAPGVPSEKAPDLFREELKSLLTDDLSNGLFVACQRNTVVGFAVAVLHQSSGGLECWLNDLGVSRNWQRQGIGRMLVERAFTWGIQEKGARYCLLESGIRNEAAHKLFEEMGFRPFSTVFWKNSDHSPE